MLYHLAPSPSGRWLGCVRTLEFTLGLVELAIYRAPDNGLLLQPRVLAKTAIFNRTIISIKDSQVLIEEASEVLEDDTELTELQKFYTGFWPEMLNKLKLDDLSQPFPRTLGKKGVVYFPMPPSGSQAWITVYFYQQRNEVGLFLTFTRGDIADYIYNKLLENQEEINKELGIPVEWQVKDDKYSIWTHRRYDDPKNIKYRTEIQEYLNDSINRFVNTFRPRLSRITDEM